MDEKELPEWLTENDDGSLQVSFKGCPIMIDGTKVEALVMREPTVGDQLAAEPVEKAKGPGWAEVTMIANLVEQAPEVIQGLTLRRYLRVQTALQFFHS
mgnify:CR=1 FL=1